MGYYSHLEGEFALNRPATIAETTHAKEITWIYSFSEDGDRIEPYDDDAKMYAWITDLQTVIDKVLKPAGLVINGDMTRYGEESLDMEKIVVTNNTIKVFKPQISWLET